MSKKKQSIFNVFTEAVGLYFSNFNKFMKYMTFPILGQLFAFILILITTYFYFTNISGIIEKYPEFGDAKVLVTLPILLILPWLAILTKAIWEFLIAYASINSMFLNMQKSGRVYDFSAHKETVTRRSFTFISIWLLCGLFSILAILPPFWIICGILFVYFVLVFQAFSFNKDLSAVGCIKKSFTLVKGNFAKTFSLIILVSLFTYLFIPQLVVKSTAYIGLNNYLSQSLLTFMNILPIPKHIVIGTLALNNSYLAQIIVELSIAQVLIFYTLPLRVIVWASWYKNLENITEFSNLQTEAKGKKSKKKRPSERLMENSHKKFTSKKLDKNIIRRASQKDDD